VNRLPATRGEAEAVLLVRPPAGPARGIVLGAKSMGRSRTALTGNCEFTLEGSDFKLVKSFYPPIKPVVFGPDANVFTDAVHVTMTCPTPDMEFRYTLEGSDPTLASPRYRGPVKLDHIARVKAIAVRPGTSPHFSHSDGSSRLPDARCVGVFAVP
jgi:hypothetical protein